MLRYLLAMGGILLGAATVFALWLLLPATDNVRTAAQDQTAPADAPLEADADADGTLRVCNRTANPISIALGYRAERGWQSEGWWVAGPDECKTVYSGDVGARRYYYIYAADDIGGGSWDGSVFMCTRDETFTIFGVEDCLARGYERTGFFEIDTQNRPSWMLQLTDNQVVGADSLDETATGDPTGDELLDGTFENLPDDIDAEGDVEE